MQAYDQAELTSADILFMALRQLGVPPSVDSFDERKRVQKLAYILQKCGVRLDYRYSWYLYGPYSPELASSLYEVATRPEYFAQRTGGQSFIPEIEKRIAKLREILPPTIGTDVLEAIASVLYIGSGWKRVLGAVKPRLPLRAIVEAQQIIRKLVEAGVVGKREVE